MATILRIELWHGLLLLCLLLALVPVRLIEPWALLFGGAFMGMNFLLLSYGVGWVLVPMAGKGKIRAGIFLLIFKFMLFLGLLLFLFFHVEFDAISFSVGFSTLLLAIVFEALVISQKHSQ